MKRNNDSRVHNHKDELHDLKLENMKLAKSLESALAVLDATRKLPENTGYPISVQEVLDYAVRLFPLTDAGLITILNEETGYDEILATYNHDINTFSRIHLRPNEGATGWTYATGQARIWNGVEGVYECVVNLDDHVRETLISADGGSLRSSLMCAPLRARGKVIGAIQIEHYSDNRQFTEVELQLLENMVASPLATVLDNFSLSGELEKKNQEIRSLLRRIITSQEEERLRVARELHDNIAQTLAGLRIAVSSVRQIVEGHEESQSVIEYLGELDDNIVQTIEMTRNMSVDLRPSILNDLGLESALKWYLRERVAKAGTETHISVDDKFDEDSIEDFVATTLFRVAQEAFSNVIRYAKASNIYVSLSTEAGEVILNIQDDGCGFSAPPNGKPVPEHIGLIGMEERMSMIGGSLEVMSRLNEGTRIKATAPRMGANND